MTNLFQPERWDEIPGFEFTNITYHCARDVAAVRIILSRPGMRNTFRLHTVDELAVVLERAHTSADIDCVLLTGNGPSPKDDGWAFCSDSNQRIQSRTGYQYADGKTTNTIDKTKFVRLHILGTQQPIRFIPKIAIALVSDRTAGGRHSPRVVSDLAIASRERACLEQTDADIGPFDDGFGSIYLARQVGQKSARQIFFLGDVHDIQEAYEMDMVNKMIPHEESEKTGLEWVARIYEKSPTAQQILRYFFNLVDDGLVGQQVLLGGATRLAYMADEAVEGRDSLLERRTPDWSGFPHYY